MTKQKKQTKKKYDFHGNEIDPRAEDPRAFYHITEYPEDECEGAAEYRKECGVDSDEEA